ncbi:NADH dehydrogenase subunit 11 [Plasmodiophora brassicae]
MLSLGGRGWRAAWRPGRRVRVATTGAPAAPKPQAPPPSQTITVNVDGRDVVCDKSMTVLQACEEAGAVIPRFCYHPRLSIAGNCRMCLVEIAKSPKPVASCAMPLLPGMVIKTDTPLVKKAREGVMEFLLINHPLDCPICDQGGECDLQDLSMSYGSDRGRYREWKRTVEDKNLGPFVKTVMTRCIHCTRCVRYADEVAGVPTLGVTGRGGTMEIGTYFERPFDSELSGNVFDLCPVGALTSKPFAFAARPWELRKTESIDVHDALGCAIRIDTRGSQVMRVLPRVNEDINEEWISDRSRFAYDGLRVQRLDEPLVRSASGELTPVVWAEAFEVIAEALQKVNPQKDVRALVGNLATAEAMICLKDWMNSMGCDDVECRETSDGTSADLRSGYLFNSTIAGIDVADLVLFVGTNIRMEAPVLNARIRRCLLATGSTPRLASIGPQYHDVTGACEQLGDDLTLLDKIADGKHPLSEAFAKAQRPMIILGQAILHRKDFDAVRAALDRLAKRSPSLFAPDWMGVNVLQLQAGRAAALDLGLVRTGPPSSGKFVYLLGADDFDDSQIPQDAFVVYQGHHGERGASRASVILPSTAYTESSGIFVNTEGRPQLTTAATTPIGLARDDWTIIRALSEVAGVGSTLPYDSIDDVRERLGKVAPHMMSLDNIDPARTISPWTDVPSSGKIQPGPIAKNLDNFFTTNVIARASKNLARGQAELKGSTNSYVQ